MAISHWERSGSTSAWSSVFNPGPQMPQLAAQQERQDFNAELMDGFRNAYNER